MNNDTLPRPLSFDSEGNQLFYCTRSSHAYGSHYHLNSRREDAALFVDDAVTVHTFTALRAINPHHPVLAFERN